MFIILEFIIVGRKGFSLGEKVIAWKMAVTLVFKQMYSHNRCDILEYEPGRKQTYRVRDRKTLFSTNVLVYLKAKKIFTVRRRLKTLFQ